MTGKSLKTLSISAASAIGAALAAATLSISLSVALLHINKLETRLNVQNDQLASRLNQIEALGKSTASEFSSLKQHLDSDMVLAANRIDAIEERLSAPSQIIRKVARSVIFLQGAYAYEDSDGNKMRFMLTESGEPVLYPNGQPVTSVAGTGDVAVRHFSGSAFVIDEDGTLITNRHLAHPWEDDGMFKPLAQIDIHPVIQKLVGYRPGSDESLQISVGSVSEDADLA